MPFLPPNQQRQSTENVTVTLCIRLAGACSRGQMSERGGAGECRSFSDTVPAMTQVSGRASTRRPARACRRYVTGYCCQSYTPPPLHATNTSRRSPCAPYLDSGVHQHVRRGLCRWGVSRLKLPQVKIIKYDTRCYFIVRSKADMSQLNLPHGTDN